MGGLALGAPRYRYVRRTQRTDRDANLCIASAVGVAEIDPGSDQVSSGARRVRSLVARFATVSDVRFSEERTTGTGRKRRRATAFRDSTYSDVRPRPVGPGRAPERSLGHALDRHGRWMEKIGT